MSCKIASKLPWSSDSQTQTQIVTDLEYQHFPPEGLVWLTESRSYLDHLATMTSPCPGPGPKFFKFSRSPIKRGARLCYPKALSRGMEVLKSVNKKEKKKECKKCKEKGAQGTWTDATVGPKS